MQKILCCISAGLLYLTCMTIHNLVASRNILVMTVSGLAVIVIYRLSPIVHIDKLVDGEKACRNRLVAQVVATNLFMLSYISYEMTTIHYVIISTALLQIVSKGLKSYVE